MQDRGLVYELPELRDRVGIFRDRAHAGEVLAGMLTGRVAPDAIVLAIPAGGVPVAAVLSVRLGLELDVAVVSKITLPWNPEAGYGAIAFDGTVRLNKPLIRTLGLDRRTIAEGIARTRRKVERRLEILRDDRPFPELTGREVVLVDDGVASGFTLLVALEAIGRGQPARRIVAVPTGHAEAIARLVAHADAVYCANVRTGTPFAVADAYRAWRDVPEEEAAELLRTAWRRRASSSSSR